MPDLLDGKRDQRVLLPAAPNAAGFGAITRGGRGGTVLHIQKLDEDGHGSLRAALEATGPRHVVFDVGVVIRMHRMIYVNDPFVSVWGQTASGSGITLFGAGIAIATRDVIFQHLRVRPGDAPNGPDPNLRDGSLFTSLLCGKLPDTGEVLHG